MNQAPDVFTGTRDVGGQMSLYQSIVAPGALTAAAASGVGNLSGTYSWLITYLTGGKDQNGTLHIGGQTNAGTPTGDVVLSTQNGALSNIPIGPAGVIARNVYRTKSTDGTVYYLAFQIGDNTSTTWTDSVPDSALGVAALTVNTTGTYLPAHGPQHLAGGTDPIPVATDSTPGLESAADKTKLDGISAGATATPLASVVPGAESAGTAGVVGVSTNAARQDHAHPAPGTWPPSGHESTHLTGGTDPIPVATESVAGLESAADKTKLDGISAGAAALTSTTPTTETVGISGAVGTATTAAKADHVHSLPGVATDSLRIVSGKLMT